MHLFVDATSTKGLPEGSQSWLKDVNICQALACEASVSVEFSALKSRYPYFWTRANWGESGGFARVQRYGYRLFSAENSTETLASQATQATSVSVHNHT